ncbi:MAG: xanthine dehydrogenase family protein subunit M [Gammaproteobacteria bacterium]|nr:xanthine dehydrogenase family protein subunit M [Gammaproteobacteria bacterium]
MSKDMMPAFQLFQPDNLESAFELAERFGKRGWILAGGQDSFDWFKDRAKRPEAVIDISNIADLNGVRETADGLEIGALTTLREVSDNDRIRKQYNLLSDAAARVASPQIRNVGTIGGNVCQDTRCWYYRAGMDCYRAGGNTCYADTPEGMDREHCLFGANRCIAVTPSDTAPALLALDASMRVQNADGEKVVAAEDFFIGPGIDIERMTILKPGEILTAITIPRTWSGATFYFEKVADRNTWDFALVNIAVAMRVDNGTLSNIRIACGGIECVPRRMKVVEDIVRGGNKDNESAMLAGGAASRGATPLNYNHFKIPLVENLVRRAIRDA